MEDQSEDAHQELIKEYTPEEHVGSKEIIDTFLTSGLDASTVNTEAIGDGNREITSVYSSLRSYCIRHKIKVRVGMRSGKVVLMKDDTLVYPTSSNVK